MTVHRDDFQKRRRPGGKGTVSPKMVNIRFRYIGPEKPTRHMILQALQYVLDYGEVPARWQLASVDWKNPRTATSWQSGGDIVDLEALAPVIVSAMDRARVAIVRR